MDYFQIDLVPQVQPLEMHNLNIVDNLMSQNLSVAAFHYVLVNG